MACSSSTRSRSSLAGLRPAPSGPAATRRRGQGRALAGVTKLLCSITAMQLHDARGKRLYLTTDERAALLAVAAHAGRPVRTLCGLLHTTGCRVSEALALTLERVDLAGRAVVLETLKKRRQGVFRAVPVPSGLLDQLDLVYGLREAQRRGRGHADRPLWPWSRMTAWRQVKAVMATAWQICRCRFLRPGARRPRRRAGRRRRPWSAACASSDRGRRSARA
jgi:integrase